MNDSKLDSLVLLLDDPDDAVFQVVLDEILKEDISVVDHLEHIWETSLDDLVQKRIESIIQQIQLNDTKKKIRAWAYQETLDLLEGFFLISKYQYPELKLRIVQAQLESIRKNIWLEFRNSLTSLEKITIINHIFYDNYRFAVDSQIPDSPQLCYINRIFESRRANPESIAILYNLVARSLNLPVYYLDIQNNPLLGYFDHEIAPLAFGDEFRNQVVFYINPSNKGAIIGPKEIDFIQNITLVTDRQKLTEACPDRIIIKRLIQKLIVAYTEPNVQEKINFLSEIVSFL